MTRAVVFLALLIALPASIGQSGETPPYDPAPPADKLSAYTNQDLEFTLFYPKEFVPRTAQDLQTAMELGHKAVFGTDPSSDPAHQQAIRCMHTLFYATAGPAAESAAPPNSDDSHPDMILVEDVDPGCVRRKEKGDQALSDLAASVLDQPQSMQVFHQMWFVAGGDRRIHSGMSATSTAPLSSGAHREKNPSPQGVTLFTIAAAVEQKGHRLMIVYLSGPAGQKHETVPHMSIAFEDARPVLLFPFLLGNVNLIK
jgi:hypothetical protein